MWKKVLLFSFLMALVGFGAINFRIQPVPPKLELDRRFTLELVEHITGLSLSTESAVVLSGFDIAIKLPIDPPMLYFGFDPPPEDMQSSLLRSYNYQIASAFQSLTPPIKSVDELLATHSETKIVTNDRVAYARFHADFPRLEFTENLKKGLADIASDEKALAILLKSEKLPPTFKILNKSLPVTVWMGWKKSPFKYSEQWGLNQKLKTTIETMPKDSPNQDDSEPVTIVAVGDIMLARGIGKRLANEIAKDANTNFPFGEILETLKNADIAIGNLECAISKRGSPMPGKDYTFRAQPSAVRQLTNAGFDIVTLANNHSKDYGAMALKDTLTYLKKAKIATIGAGRNRKEARAFKVLTTKDGTRVGFLGYTMVLPVDFLADTKKTGVAWAKENGLDKDIKAAKAACDVLMVQYHWGIEYTVTPTKAQRTLAHKTIDLGADIVIGHHPHWIQEVEFYKDKFIAYSLGNFVFDMNHRPKVTEGMVVTCELRDKKISQIHCDPVSIKAGQPKIITWDQATEKRTRRTILEEIFIASGLIKSEQGLPNQALPINLTKKP